MKFTLFLSTEWIQPATLYHSGASKASFHKRQIRGFTVNLGLVASAAPARGMEVMLEF